MKKVSQFFVVMISMLFIYTESNAKGNLKGILSEKSALYVKWSTVPSNPSRTDVVSWLKAAMQGSNTISGATVNSNRNSYEKVWGTELYNQILNASESDFTIVKSDGSEKNYGVDLDSKNPVFSGMLGDGLPLIAYKGLAIAKWGSNGCINAVSASKKTITPEEDPDNKKPGSTTTTTNNNKEIFVPAGGGNSIVIMTGGSTQGTGGGELSWGLGYQVYSQGRNDRQNDFIVDASLFKMIQDSKTCCGGFAPSSVTTVAAAAPPAQNYYYSTANPSGNAGNNNNVSYPSEITVRNKPNVLDWINTGANVFNATMNGINAFRGYRIEGNRQQNSGYNNTWNNGNNNGYTGSGQIRFEGPSNNRTGYGQNSNSGYTNTNNNNNGSYGNTWNGSSY